MALPIGDILWPNCLNRAIKNASIVDVDDFSERVKKSSARIETGIAEATGNKGSASRTRSKSSIPVHKPSLAVHSISSESKESPIPVNDLEMSSGLKYARVICYLILYVMCLLFSLCTLLIVLSSFDPCFLIVEVKPSVFKPCLSVSRTFSIRGPAMRNQLKLRLPRPLCSLALLHIPFSKSSNLIHSVLLMLVVSVNLLPLFPTTMMLMPNLHPLLIFWKTCCYHNLVRVIVPRV